jgi:hypothetical protein
VTARAGRTHDAISRRELDVRTAQRDEFAFEIFDKPFSEGDVEWLKSYDSALVRFRTLGYRPRALRQDRSPDFCLRCLDEYHG